MTRLHGALHGLLKPEHELDVQVAKALALAAQLVFQQLADTRAFLHEDERDLGQLVHGDRPPRGGVSRRADEDHLVREERLELDRTTAAGGADDPELELTLGDEGHHGLRVVHGQANLERRILLMELAKRAAARQSPPVPSMLRSRARP